MLKLLTAAIARHYLRKPDLQDFLATRLPDAGSLLAAARNELAFLIGAARLPVVTQLNVELTSRCNVACSYCDVNRGLRRQARDLDLDVLARLLQDTPTVRVLLPFQWGEPLLYPQLDEAVALATRRGVRTFLTTNGTLLDGPRLAQLSAAGLARLTVSLDGTPQDHAARRGYAQEPILARLAEARAAQRQGRLPVRLDVSMVVDETVADRLPDFRARLAPLCDRVQFIPRLRAGRRTRACREPWRGSLVVLSDGRVTACCADAQGRLALGRVETGARGGGPTPAQLHAAPAFVELRRAQRRGTFPGPCATCDECDVPGVSRRFS
jgi:sulfatase maturation enzyme AslB (radical SAM superfamily)